MFRDTSFLALSSLLLTMPTIVHVLNGLCFGGVETNCLHLLKHAPAGVRSILYNLDPTHSEMAAQFRAVPGLTLHNTAYEPSRRLASFARLVRALSQDKPDAVLVHPYGVRALVAAAARLAGVRRIFTTNANPVAARGEPRHRLFQLLALGNLSLHTQVIFCSEAMRSAYGGLGVPAPRGSHVIHYGCEVESIRARAEAARQQRTSCEGPVIGMVARLNSIKDQRTLLRALPLVRKTVPRASVWLVGAGEELESLQKLAQELGVAPAVRFSAPDRTCRSCWDDGCTLLQHDGPGRLRDRLD